MIRVNCQYNVGGFRLFKLFLNQEQPCILSDLAEQSCDAPAAAMKYINVEGAKAVYQKMEDGQYVFIIRSIPSIHYDDAGRATQCAAIISGDSSDKRIMDNIVIAALNNIAEFEQFFSSLFAFTDDRNVGYDASALTEYIKDKQSEKRYEGHSKLLKVTSKSSGIILFVPKSNDWQNPAVQDKVFRLLHISESDLKNAIVLTHEELSNLTNLLTITTIVIEDDGDDDKGKDTGNGGEDEGKKDPKDPGNPDDSKGKGQGGEVVITGETKGPQNTQKDLKFYLLKCYALLSVYIDAWEYVLKKHKGQVPKWEKAFIFSHIIILLLVIILIIVKINCK